MPSDPKMNLGKIWGVLLFAAGLGMFFTIPEKVQVFQAQGRYFYGMKPVLYLISVLLMVGGGKKIFRKNSADVPPNDNADR